MDDPFTIKIQDGLKDSHLNNYASRTDQSDFWFGDERISGSFEAIRLSIPWRRLRLFFLVIITLTLLLVLRIFYLQIIEGDYYRGIAEGNRIRINPIKAPRGVIYDYNKELLVRNIPNFSLFLVPGDLPKEKIELINVLKNISKILDIPSENLEQLVKKTSSYSYEPILVAENIDHDRALLLEIEISRLPGVNLEIRSGREYLFSSPDYGLSHILGYTGKLTEEEFQKNKDKGYLLNDYIGKTGVELNYESYLRGKDGKKRIEVDFLGKEEKVISSTQPHDGSNIILAVKLNLQKKVWEILKENLKKTNKEKAVIILENVDTGEVLTLVSFPSYDNNLFAKGISPKDYENLINNTAHPLFNRAIAGEYPSGSTIKPLLSAAALQEGIITEKTTFLSTGGIWVGEWFFPDWKPGGHGRTNVTRALAESINTFFYYIGGGYEDFKGLGIEKIVFWGNKFCLGKTTFIDIPGEKEGFLPTREWKKNQRSEPWYIGDTYHLSIGQGDILVTPIQIVNYISAIANGGTFYQPHVIKEIIDSENKKIELYKTPLYTGLVDKKYLEIVKKGMREGVTTGSSRSLASLPFKVAGKTGTAQIGGEKEPHAWFVGFAPYENPEIAIVILIENGGEGSQTAVPIAKEILSYYFEH